MKEERFIFICTFMGTKTISVDLRRFFSLHVLF